MQPTVTTGGLVALHTASLTGAAFLVALATALGDSGEGLAVLSLALPVTAALLLPFAARTAHPGAARAGVLLGALPYAALVAGLEHTVVLGMPVAHRSSVPIGEAHPLSPLVWSLLVPLLGAALLLLATGPLRRRLERASLGRAALPLAVALAASSAALASHTLGRPRADAWLDAQPLVAAVPVRPPGRSLHRVDATHLVEAYSRGGSYSDELYLRSVEEGALAGRPLAGPADVEALEDSLPACHRPDGQTTHRCRGAVWVSRQATVAVRRHGDVLFVGEHAYRADGVEIDLPARAVVSEIALPPPLVLGAWLGLLLALWSVVQARGVAQVEGTRRPVDSLLEGARPFALLLLLFTQAPLIAAYLSGALR